MKASTISGNHLAYEERGAGVPVLFIHGLTFNRHTWDPVLDQLTDRFRCIAVDLPGHGGSTGLPHTLEETGLRIHALVSDLGIERPIVVGHSLGGIEATMYASIFPVSGVINVDQPLDVRPFVGFIQQMAPALQGPDFAAAFEPIRQQIGVELLPEPLRTTTLATQTICQDLVLAYWNEIFQRRPEELQAIVDAAAGRITAPYLAVFGHRLAEEERAALHARISKLELEEWPDRGHMVHLMEPDRFANRLASFVDAYGVA